MSIKIAFTGAGSIGFTRRLLADVLAVPELAKTRISFHDISEANLEMVRKLCQRDIEANGLDIVIEATTNRRKAFKDADFVLCTVRVGGLEAFAKDIEIPLEYGVDQCVGDTLAPGGIMYAQRGIPVILDICKDIREVAAPGCRLLNYANPMAMMTWAANKYGGVETIGLCHGVQGGHNRIAKTFGLEKKDLDIICAGINHQTWYISIRHGDKELTPKLLAAMEKDEWCQRNEKVRVDMLRRFGYFSTESNGHLSEYLPWYRKDAKEIRRWIGKDNWIQGETGGYLRVCTEGRRWFETDFPNWMKEPPLEFKEEDRSQEHGGWIIEGLTTGRPYRGHFNVVNGGVITNLPPDAIIEAPGWADRHGINMPVVGDLPLGCAAVCNQSISVQRLGVEAAVHGDVELLKQAMLLDPLTGALLNTEETWQMTDAMLVALAPWLPQYKKAITAAKRRLKKEPSLARKPGWKGAARKQVATMASMKKSAERMRRLAGASEKGGK